MFNYREYFTKKVLFSIKIVDCLLCLEPNFMVNVFIIIIVTERLMASEFAQAVSPDARREQRTLKKQLGLR